MPLAGLIVGRGQTTKAWQNEDRYVRIQPFPYIDEHMDITHYLEPEQINAILAHAKKNV